MEFYKDYSFFLKEGIVTSTEKLEKEEIGKLLRYVILVLQLFHNQNMFVCRLLYIVTSLKGMLLRFDLKIKQLPYKYVCMSVYFVTTIKKIRKDNNGKLLDVLMYL